MKKILHITMSPIAGAVGALSNAINRYSKYSTTYESYVYAHTINNSCGNYDMDYKNNITTDECRKLLQEVDIIHLHNLSPEEAELALALPKIRKLFLIQLHSEPLMKSYVVDKYPTSCITLAQKHALLYKSLPSVPNVIDIFNQLYKPVDDEGDKLKIVYSPTSLGSREDYKDTCQGKGYDKTLKILSKLNNINIKVLKGISKEEVINEKQTADIVIDECVTGGYHLSSLEGLATGNIVVGYIMPEIEDILCKLTGCKNGRLPWFNTHIDELEGVLNNIINMDRDELEIYKNYSRSWMEQYWHPKNMIKKYISIYNSMLGVKI